MLYRTVDLSRCTARALLSWCLAVTRRTQLAERVHTLTMGLSTNLSFSSDVAKIARALSKCINIKELTIHQQSFGSFGPRVWAPHSIQGWIITKCPFRLTKFSNSFFKNDFLAQLWNSQSDIRVLSLPNCIDRFPAFDDQLPKLIALEIGHVYALPADRALQHIHLHWHRYSLDALSSLGSFSASLTTFTLNQTLVTPRVSTLEILHKIAHELPALRHLALIETDEDTKIDQRFSEGSPLSALAKFKQLQTFTIYCQRITSFNDFAHQRAYHLADLPSLQAFAHAITNACPTLQRVIVAARRYPHTGPKDWQAGSERIEQTCTVNRTVDGVVKSEIGTRFDFRAVSMF
ncbi:hypothetical protein C8R43DRAFT_969234 [Mycena crocata]|nr:hypothetical protein C8R43DRAFT_969234 [Mycena crocata]